MMLANNEVGSIQPIKEISALTREREIAFHTDAVAAVGQIEIKVEELGVDALRCFWPLASSLLSPSSSPTC